MKFRLLAGLTLSAFMFTIAAPSSYADTTPSPSPTSTPLTALEQYKLELEIFKDQMSEREQVRKDITKEFMVKVASANSTAKIAMRTAKTADSKSAILAQQKTAVALAAAIRDTAISNMGPAPVEPVKPSKPEPLKSSKAEPSKSESAKPTKSESAKPTKSESAKPEPSKSAETTTVKKTKSPKASPTPTS